MSSTLFDAQPYDEATERRRRIRIVCAIVAVIAIAALLCFNRYWPEEHRVDQFFRRSAGQELRGGLRNLDE